MCVTYECRLSPVPPLFPLSVCCVRARVCVCVFTFCTSEATEQFPRELLWSALVIFTCVVSVTTLPSFYCLSFGFFRVSVMFCLNCRIHCLKIKEDDGYGCTGQPPPLLQNQEMKISISLKNKSDIKTNGWFVFCIWSHAAGADYDNPH